MTGVQPTVLCKLPVTKTCACSLAKQSHQEYLSIYSIWVWREKQYAIVQLWPFFVFVFVLEKPIKETNNNMCQEREKSHTWVWRGKQYAIVRSCDFFSSFFSFFFLSLFVFERPVKETNNNICVKKEKKKVASGFGEEEKKKKKKYAAEEINNNICVKKERKKSHLGLEKKKKIYAAVHNHGLFWKVSKRNCNKNISVEKKDRKRRRRARKLHWCEKQALLPVTALALSTAWRKRLHGSVFFERSVNETVTKIFL